MNRTLVALLVAGALIVGRAVSGDEAEPAPQPADRYLDLARQYAEVLSPEELEKEATALEAKLKEAKAARELQRVRAELEAILKDHAGTEAAKAAGEMLKPPEKLVPVNDPFGGAGSPFPQPSFDGEPFHTADEVPVRPRPKSEQ